MDEKDLTIENRLKEVRKERKLSQEELADAIGISRQSIIALEQGKSMPSLPLAVSFCRYFDSTFEDLFEFEREVHREISEAICDGAIEIKVINSPEYESGLRKDSTMVELEPWKPFRETVSLRDAMDRLLEDSFITPAKAGGMPRIDVRDKKGSIVVKAEMPGIMEEDINVEILDNVMTISGEKKEEKEEKEGDKGYYYKESHTGKFSRSFTLPSEVMTEKAVAEMKHGILTITVPKVEPKKAQKINIASKK
jgi:HSP20 family protein